MSFERIGVIGGGAWGTALAQVTAEGGETLLWALEPVDHTTSFEHEPTERLPLLRFDRHPPRAVAAPLVVEQPVAPALLAAGRRRAAPVHPPCTRSGRAGGRGRPA